jgi:hypothetical protein
MPSPKTKPSDDQAQPSLTPAAGMGPAAPDAVTEGANAAPYFKEAAPVPFMDGIFRKDF